MSVAIDGKFYAADGEVVELIYTLQSDNVRFGLRLTQFEIAMRGAIAALSQNKTFPADIEAAKHFLSDALDS